ncbi:hypothetical protein SAMN02745163_00660 [Clostridium cavendishii DSM 21758]|uniref:Uncharacterized protein n=1 Tax=Clostridium cavendishii DSM 21758 TaxID=1121302 RepID=A0A1M6D8H6_9CLOT|nr:hypothetical protein [Clostridium cavendishii]SHI69493.1 hypothetical protein SAMN02745163_00660 [Clostridium cavendishii DSM 21758]
MSNKKSSKDSNLSNYGYDMVVATTQDSINATLKQYLYKMESTEYVVAYSITYDEKGHSLIKEISYHELVEKIGIDLFKISEDNKTQKEIDAINKAYDDFDFYMAIKGSIGIDKLTNGFPDIIELLESDISSTANVSYKAYFNNLEFVYLKEHKSNVYFNNLKQPKDNPWIFKFNVKLDLQDEDFKNLPIDIQKQIKNLDPETMFSVKQLYLDLNSAKLQSCPTIEGVSEGTEEYDLINRFFVKIYWKGLKDSDKGDVIFGYALAPLKKGTSYNNNSNYDPNYIIVPTNFTFYVSTYSDPKTGKKNPGLNTLNYVVMCDGHLIPKLKPFTWNWLESNEQSNKHGSISINRNDFASKMANQLMNSLKLLLLQPKVAVKKNGSDFHLEIYLEPCEDKVEPIVVTESGSKVLTYKFSRKDSDDDKYGLLRKASASLEYILDYSVEFINNKIIITTKIETPLKVDPGAITKTAKGEIASYVLTDIYTLFVDVNGGLDFKYKHDSVYHQDDFDAGIWTNMCFKNFNEFIDKYRYRLKKAIDDYCFKYNKSMGKNLNKSLNWVFPGNSSFIFSNVSFSNYQDLIVNITYAQEN